MARKASNKTKTTTPRRRNKKQTNISSITNLEAARDQAKRNHLLAEGTTEKYDGYVARGKEFLEELVKSMQEDLKANHNLTEVERATQTQELEHLSQAFNPIPNSQSARALELFITEKCFAQGRGMPTGSGIHAGFKKYWDKK